MAVYLPGTHFLLNKDECPSLHILKPKQIAVLLGDELTAASSRQ
jgi:hypothetical protein